MNNERPEILDALSRKNECYLHYKLIRHDSDLSLVQFGHHKTPVQYGYGPMTRDHYLIHFVKSGRGRLFIHDSEYLIQEGQCFLLYPYQIAYYEADADDPWEYYWIGFTGLKAESLVQKAGFSYEKNALSMYYAEQIFKSMAIMVAAINESDNLLFLEGMLQIVLYHLTRRAPEDAASMPMPPIVRTGQVNRQGEEYVRIITSIIKTSYREQISVEQLAHQLGLNRSYLTELFKKYTGQSIKQYLTSYRISMSLKYLKDPSQTVKDVAYQVGFPDPLYFSRLFKRYEGCSPQEYRDKSALPK